MESSGWWDWVAFGQVSEENFHRLSENEMRRALEKLAERCVLLENLSPKVTPHTIRGALEQFGMVLKVKMLRNPQDMKLVGAAIVDMMDLRERDQVVKELTEYLFMCGVIPRPVRAIAATPFLMLDHPWRRNPNRIRPQLIGMDYPRGAYLQERDYIDRMKVDDDEKLLRLMEIEEIKLAHAQDNICREKMEKLRLIRKEKRSGTIAKVGELHGLFIR